MRAERKNGRESKYKQNLINTTLEPWGPMRPYAKGALTYGKHIFTANKCTTKCDLFIFLLLKEYAIVYVPTCISLT